MDAALCCLGASGYQRVSMEAIAAQAKISRATLYRYFSSRDEVLAGAVLRETRRHLTRIVPEAKQEPDMGAAILAFVRLILDAGQHDPTIAALVSSDNYLFTRGVLIDSGTELFEIMADCLGALFEGRRHELSPELTMEEASEWLLRIVLSLLTIRGPVRRTRAEIDDYLSRGLLPMLLADR